MHLVISDDSSNYQVLKRHSSHCSFYEFVQASHQNSAIVAFHTEQSDLPSRIIGFEHGISTFQQASKVRGPHPNYEDIVLHQKGVKARIFYIWISQDLFFFLQMVIFIFSKQQDHACPNFSFMQPIMASIRQTPWYSKANKQSLSIKTSLHHRHHMRTENM